VPTEPGDAPQGENVYQRLIAEIRSGALPPGARLRETELAERLGVSRTPIREAIRQLENDGLVSHLPRVGAAVRSLDYAEVMELYDMRAVLEGTAARMAARAATDLELTELAALNAEMGDAPTAQRAADLNTQFHLTLLDAARNRYLTRAMLGLRRTLIILGPSTLADAARAQDALAEHGRLLAALQRRDPLAAEAEMRAHIEGAHRMRLRQLRDRDREVSDD
jgi:DNA-binding GntR family transcriptional regulator